MSRWSLWWDRLLSVLGIIGAAVWITAALVGMIGGAVRAGVSLNPDGHAVERARTESTLIDLRAAVDDLQRRVTKLEEAR